MFLNSLLQDQENIIWKIFSSKFISTQSNLRNCIYLQNCTSAWCYSWVKYFWQYCTLYHEIPTSTPKVNFNKQRYQSLKFHLLVLLWQMLIWGVRALNFKVSIVLKCKAQISSSTQFSRLNLSRNDKGCIWNSWRYISICMWASNSN